MRYTGKIFCLGAFRTGTVSLGQALRILGYKVCGNHPKLREGWERFKDTRDMAPYEQLLKKFDVLVQQPVATRFHELFAHYPNAKYILTTRNVTDWLFSRAVLHMHTWFDLGLYHDNAFSPNNARKWFENHNRCVCEQAEIHVRPENFMEMDITAGDGWDKLCGFLGCDVPHRTDFPRANSSEQLLRQVMSKRVRKTGARSSVGMGSKDDG
jgi:hypothetical protein